MGPLGVFLGGRRGWLAGAGGQDVIAPCFSCSVDLGEKLLDWIRARNQ